MLYSYCLVARTDCFEDCAFQFPNTMDDQENGANEMLGVVSSHETSASESLLPDRRQHQHEAASTGTLPSSEIVYSAPCKHSLSVWVGVIAMFVVNRIFMPKHLDWFQYAVEGLLAAALLFFLPIRIDVRSDATIEVVTFCRTFSYPAVVRVIKAQDSACCCAIVDAACNIKSQVCVLRQRGQSDVYLSPQDPEEFLQTVNAIANQFQQQEDEMDLPHNFDNNDDPIPINATEDPLNCV